MKVYTLFFTDESVPRFLGIDHNPRAGETILTAEAKPCQVGIINKVVTLNKSSRYKRDLDVEYIPGTPATVRVRSYPQPVPPQQSTGIIVHMPDGSRFFRHLDGTMEPMPPIDWEA